MTPLSEIFEYLEIKKKGNKKKVEEWKPPSTFERSTTKYWVKYEDLLKLKIDIIKHLPVLIFKRKKFYEDLNLDLNDSELLSKWCEKTLDSSKITSVYLDETKEFKFYHNRIERKEGAQLFRFRWYGNKKDESHIVFPERKTHHESWTTDTSTKERVSIKWKHVSKYMSNEWNIEKFVDKQFREGKITEKEKNIQINLSKEIQESILKENLKPVVRTAYQRSAFQLSTSNLIRISIDTKLTFNDEDLPIKDDWCLKSPEITLEFPYAVFEVKLQDESPDWLINLLQNYEQKNSIIPVYKFSKFLQSCCIFHKDKISILPHWLSEEHEELKPLYEKIKEVEDKLKLKKEKDEKKLKSFNKQDIDFQRKLSISNLGKSEIKIGSGNEKTPLISSQSMKSLNSDLYSELDMDHDNHQNENEKKDSIFKTTFEKIKNYFNPKLDKNKKKFVPTKIEPKTFFANERTFMNWISTSVLIQTMAFLLLNLGNKIGAMILSPFCILFLAYALYTYCWRSYYISIRKDVSYHDKCGPPFLVLICKSFLFFFFFKFL